MENFINQINSISNDETLVNYFVNNNKNIHEFLKFYIQIDKLLENGVSTSSTDNFNDKLNEIKSAINNNSAQIVSLQNNINNTHNSLTNLLQNKMESLSICIKDVANTDIKIMFSELQKQVS
jgi:hypothetical protein